MSGRPSSSYIFRIDSVASSPSRVVSPKTNPSITKSRLITSPDKIDFFEF